MLQSGLAEGQLQNCVLLRYTWIRHWNEPVALSLVGFNKMSSNERKVTNKYRSYTTLVYSAPDCSCTFRLVLCHPQAVQDFVNRQCATVYVILTLYGPCIVINFKVELILIMLAASQRGCTLNTINCTYSKLSPEDEQFIYLKHAEDITGINLKRKCVSLVLIMQIYRDARSI